MLSSCSDFLNIRTEASLPTSGMDYTKVENVFQPVSAAYAKMRLSEGAAQGYVGVLEIVSDDADKGAGTDGPTVAELDHFTYTPTNVHINDMWIYFYDIVSSANYAVESMEEFDRSITSEDGKKVVAQCRGEAKIIRAFAYFNLVRLFGSVPLITETMTSEQLGNLAPSSVEAVYQQIYEDCDDAIAVVPESYSELKGRYTKYTAMALKAKAALYNKDWDEAAAQADAVIASGKFELLSDFREVFAKSGEYSKESLMEIGSSDLGQSTGGLPVCYYGFIQGPRNNTPSNMQGWGYKSPSPKFIEFMDSRGDDIRKEATVLVRGTVTPEGDLIAETCSDPFYNAKVYTPSSDNDRAFNAYGLDHNMRLLRYSDVLLIYAEAMAQGASIVSKSGYSADDALNEVRERAGLAPVAATLDNIYDERRAEFAMEENRFFDLVRTGRATAVLSSLGYTSKNAIFPTPAAQIKVNGALNQTPGYQY